MNAGAAFVKVGFGDISSADRITALTAAAVRGARSSVHNGAGVVAVAYVDAHYARALSPLDVFPAAQRAGALGVLLDTANKSGPSLCAHLQVHALTTLVAKCHQRGLLLALAGRLTEQDLPRLLDTGADIVGVRGAACTGGRTGRISVESVRRLRNSFTNDGERPCRVA